jgi:hypothetical protein
MPAEIFSIFWHFKNEGMADPEEKANRMIDVLEKYPHWKKSDRHERKVKQEIYKVLIQAKVGDASRISEIVQRILREIKRGAE